VKKSWHYASFPGFLSCIALLFSACSPIVTPPTPSPLPSPTPTQASPAASLSPSATPVATVLNSAPDDGSLDAACRITIGLFFSYKQGFTLEAYRNLFTPASQYLADSVAPPAEARILLNLMPASQHWAQNFPGTPMPGAIMPGQPNEYVYYADFTYHYESDTTPISPVPDHMTLHMIADSQNNCKITSYGKG
jgi:hypothetical protein